MDDHLCLTQMGKRPRLTNELEAMRFTDEPAMTGSSTEAVGLEVEGEIMRFLVELFRRCTKGNPADRPTSVYLYDVLHARAISFASSTS